MALHENSVGMTDEWYTPKYVFDALGCQFDLDVAHPGNGKASWIPASECITEHSLAQQWDGFIWMNPPFGGRNGLRPWLNKFFSHGNGIALVPDRTSAPWWQEYVHKSSLILFVSKKIKFIDQHGNEGRSPAQGTVLLAVGNRASVALLTASGKGLGQVYSPVRTEASNPKS